MGFPTVIASVWAARPRSNLSFLSFYVDSVLPVTCNDIVTLNAILNGDPTGYTFEWVQMSGTPVIWLEDRDQTVVMFQQPVLRDDKVFRFYLNKGKSTERYKEVLVTAVPTDNYFLSQTKVYSSCSVSALGSPSIISYSLNIPVYRPPGSEAISDPQRAVLYNRPSGVSLNSSTLPVIYLLEKTSNGYVEVAQEIQTSALANSQGLIQSMGVDKIYKLRIVNNNTIQDSEEFSLSSETFQTKPDLAVTEIDLISLSASKQYSASTIDEVISRLLVGLNINDIEDSHTLNIDKVISSSTIDEVISRSLQSMSVEDIDDSITFSLSPFYSSSIIVENISLSRSSLG